MPARFLPSFVLALTLAAGCGPSRTIVHLPQAPDAGDTAPDGGRDAGLPDGADGGSGAGVDGGSRGWPGVHLDGGTAAILQIGSWNMEWFGDATQAPNDDVLQYSNARPSSATPGWTSMAWWRW